MRILSKFTDYYDGAQGLGTDASKVYVRETMENLVVTRDLPNTVRMLSKGLAIKAYEGPKVQCTVRGKVVLFAGKVYRGLHIVAGHGVAHGLPDTRWVPGVKRHVLEEAHVFEPGQALSLLAKYLPARTLDNSNWGHPVSLRKRVELELSQQGSGELFDFASNNRIAIALYVSSAEHRTEEKVLVVTNPVLRDIEFYKVFEAWAAYQELDMYWGGILAPESRPMAQIEDKYRVEQHGFDKLSFRKAPTKPKG
jgi:hypothetical protein